MSPTIHTTYIHTWVKCIDMNNTRINCKRIVYGVGQVYAQRLTDHPGYSANLVFISAHIFEDYRYVAA